jgi:membrane protein DedA with SNARE-associated domain
MNGMTILTAGFQGTVQWVLQHGYFFVFVLMLVEGPVVTAAAAFAAALRYFDIWIVFILSIFANLIPDAIYYAIGYWGRNTFIDKYGHYFGISKQGMKTAERLAEKHSGKSLLVMKLVPLLATPGLILVGATKMKIREYAFWCTVITVPTSLVYLLVGYYFGTAYTTIDHYLHLGIYLVIGAVIVIVLIIYLQRKLIRAFAEHIEKHSES